MIYKKYGKTFRTLRRQKKLSLSSFTSIALTKSTLSKFERGETMMAFDKVLSSLQILGISLEEFEFLLNGSSLDDTRFFIQEIEQAVIEQNIERLKEISNIAKLSNLDLISLTAKSTFTYLNEKEIEILTDYFFSLELWLVTDLWLLSIVIKQLEIHDLLHILDQLFNEQKKWDQTSLHSYHLIKGICNATVHLIALGYKDYAKYLLDNIRTSSMIKTSTHNFMFLQNLYNLTFGYWTFAFQDSSKGKATIQKALKILEEIGTLELFNYFKNLYDKLLS